MTSLQATATSPTPARRPGGIPDLVPDPAVVSRIRDGIRLRDRGSVATFGEDAQRGASSQTDAVLGQVMARDSGPVGDMLADMLDKARGVDPSDLARLGFVDRLRGGLKSKLVRYKESFSTVAAQVDRIQLQLERRIDTLKRDIAQLDGLYDANVRRMVDLQAFIVAGEGAIAQARDHDLPALRERAAAAGDGVEGQVLAQEVSDLAQAIERFERRVHDLKLSRTLALQRLPQIRLVQNGDATLVDKLMSGIANAIPAWKDGMVIAIGLNNQAGAVRVADAVDATTDAMVRRNADMMRTNAVEIERAAQRGFVGVETLAHVNRQFIATVEDILAVQREGREERRRAGAEIERIEGELRHAVLGATA